MYVAAVPALALAAGVAGAVWTDWQLLDILKFVLLLACGIISVASTPRIMYTFQGVTRDFTAVWVLPTAVLLQPVYSVLMPIPMLAVLQFWVHPGVVHRRVFSAASTCLSYAAVSLIFHRYLVSFSGASVGTGIHAFWWCAAVAICEIIAGRAQHFFIVAAVKLNDPSVRIWNIEWNREALQGLFAEIDLGVLITLVIALSPSLAIIALPTVLLVRRFMVHPHLVAQSRVDAKTGLLNVATWETEAYAELSRAIRMRSPMAVAIVDIDHFKLVNDTYGHLVGDRVLTAVADALRGQLRDYDKAGRFGGEEFVLLLAQAVEHDACRVADRLRAYVADMKVPVNDSPNAERVRVTISIGVTAMEADQSRTLTDMLAAADSALYQAKQTGRNRVCVARQIQKVELEIGIPDLPDAVEAEVVEADAAGASLALLKSL
ncbi:MAG: GGDEF domain-containing protein [Trebonia sp.]